MNTCLETDVGKGTHKVAWRRNGQGFTKINFFEGKANVTMIKLQASIENRVGSGKNRLLH